MSKSLLVVDHSPAIHKVIRIALSRHNFEVVPAANVAEANAELRKRTFSLVLVDSGVSPDLKTFESIKSASRQVPVLVLMSGLDKLREEDLRSIGINIFLRKPFEAKEILATVLKVLGIKDDSVSTPPGLPPTVGQAAPLGNTLPPTPPASHNQQLPPLPIGGETPPAIPKREKSPVSDWSMGQIAPENTRSSEGRDFNAGPPVFTDFEAMSPHEDPAVVAARLPLQDNSKRGKKAFGERDSDNISGRTTLPPRPDVERLDRSQSTAGESPSLPVMPINIGMTSGEIAQVIKNAVNDYCIAHFEAIAREIITAELRRLADEKSRHLLDG